MNEKHVELILKYSFRNKELLKRALTHPSYFSERNLNYQKLEYLGDSILDFVVAEYLYREYSDKNEGELTRMRAAVVSKTALSKIVIELGLDRYVYVSQQGAMSAKMRSDVYEAIVAAIYLDGGLDAVKSFISDTVIPKISEQVEDYKSKLLEYGAKNNININFEITSDGPSHKKHFYAKVFIDGKECGAGEGYSITEAHQKASKKAYFSLS